MKNQNLIYNMGKNSKRPCFKNLVWYFHGLRGFFLIKKLKIRHMFNVPANHTKSYFITIRSSALVCIPRCEPNSKTRLQFHPFGPHQTTVCRNSILLHVGYYGITKNGAKFLWFYLSKPHACNRRNQMGNVRKKSAPSSESYFAPSVSNVKRR